MCGGCSLPSGHTVLTELRRVVDFFQFILLLVVRMEWGLMSALYIRLETKSPSILKVKAFKQHNYCYPFITTL